ncbi:MAG: bifunctional precorrin-2 dehydrogenase/sirohydrochlorin ferrochelatase [Desulfobacteraceae bacterium]|nr:bifunctional precorrin-2 dehydrogenase/sirohydrochlorin ferrochelatase [Desulfobacteraceae bacterium]
MKYYPVNLDINDRDCLVVGGGKVGVRKAKSLARCGARVTVVSQAFDPALRESCPGAITLKRKAYQSKDLDGMFLVIGATDSRELNRAIAVDAREQGVLFNGADLPELSNFIVPAVVNRGDLTVAVSTSGNSPAFARKIKQDLEQQFGPEYQAFLSLMGRIRTRLLARGHAPDEHRRIFRKLINGELFDLVKGNDHEQIDHLLVDLLGKEYRNFFQKGDL